MRPRRVDVHLHLALEEATDRLERAALQAFVIALLDEIAHRRHADRDADELVRVVREIIRQLIIRAETRQQDVDAERAQHLAAIEEVLVIDRFRRAQRVQRDLGQHDRRLALHFRLLHEPLARAIEEIERQLRRGSAACAASPTAARRRRWP
jgi:hypothetical protein